MKNFEVPLRVRGYETSFSCKNIQSLEWKNRGFDLKKNFEIEPSDKGNIRRKSLPAQFHLFVLSRSYTALTHRTFFHLRRCMHAGDCHVVRCVWRFANWENVRFVGKTSEARVSRSYIIVTLLSVNIFLGA